MYTYMYMHVHALFMYMYVTYLWLWWAHIALWIGRSKSTCNQQLLTRIGVFREIDLRRERERERGERREEGGNTYHKIIYISTRYIHPITYTLVYTRYWTWFVSLFVENNSEGVLGSRDSTSGISLPTKHPHTLYSILWKIDFKYLPVDPSHQS